jgi:hypothetical protein
MYWINFAVSLFSILIMSYSIYIALKLVSLLKGGIVKKRLVYLTSLLFIFLLGYLFTFTFLIFGDNGSAGIIIYLIFFFGAVFVSISISTIKSILMVSGIIK